MISRRQIMLTQERFATISGPITSFNTRRAAPLKECLVNIKPVQSGSGDPSLDNVRPITGWTGMQIHRTGVNLLSGDDLHTVLAKTYTFTVTDTEDGRRIGFTAAQASSYFRISSRDMHFKENTQYTLIAKDYRSTSGSQNIKIFYTNGTNEYLWSANSTTTIHRKVSAANKTISYIGGSNAGGTTRLYIDTFGIFEGVVALDDYAAYQGTIVPITFPATPGTVYSGTLDVLSGILTVDAIKYVFDGSESWSTGSTNHRHFIHKIGSYGYVDGSKSADNLCNIYPFVSITSSNDVVGVRVLNSTARNGAYVYVRPSGYNDLTVTQFKAFLAQLNTDGTPLEVLAYIANPITYQLDPVTLTTLKGQNNLWVDIGDISATYRVN